jgi:hypothetical protein
LVFTIGTRNLANNSVHFIVLIVRLFWVKIQFRYMFLLFMKLSSGDTFYNLK